MIAFLLFFSLHAFAVDEDPAYRSEVATKVKVAIASIEKASTDATKIEEVKKLKSEMSSEKERVRKDLDLAKEAKSENDQITKLDARDTEIVRIWYSLNTVFKKVLDDSFVENVEFRRKTCESLPHDVEFADMAPMPDESTPPDWTALSFDLVKAICSRSRAPGH